MSNDTQSTRIPTLKPDFSHQIAYGNGLEDEFLCTLTVLQEELAGLFGVLTHLLKTTEESRLGAAVATGITQELENFGSLLNIFRKEDVTDSIIEKLRASHAELEKMNNVLDECLDESENDQFGFNLVLMIHKRIQDIIAVLNAFCEQSKEGGDQ